MSGNPMKLVVVGAAGRMGQTLIRTIHAIKGAEVFAAVEREGSPFVGRDAGELAGLGPIGVPVTDKPLEAFVAAEGVLDFTAPTATAEFAGPRRRPASCMWSAPPAARPPTTRRSRPPPAMPAS